MAIMCCMLNVNSGKKVNINGDPNWDHWMHLDEKSSAWVYINNCIEIK